MTIIYLQEYGKTNTDAFDMFANQKKTFQFAPLVAKILIPQAPKIILDALKGRSLDTDYSWYNMFQGSINHIGALGQLLFNSQRLYD